MAEVQSLLPSIDRILAELQKQFRGKSGILSFDVSHPTRTTKVVRVYVVPSYSDEQRTLRQHIRERAAPYSVLFTARRS